jgi:hypothetical protein
MSIEIEDTVGNGSLSERDELLATLVATGATIKAAGDELQLSVRQAYRIAAGPAFKARVSEIRTEAMTAALGSLAQFARAAAERLSALTSCGDLSVELRASTAILDRFGKLSESVDLRQRVELLEKQVKQ